MNHERNHLRESLENGLINFLFPGLNKFENESISFCYLEGFLRLVLIFHSLNFRESLIYENFKIKLGNC